MALSVAIAAILGAYIGQLTLNEHARNLSLAIQDANRVIEQLRQQNVTSLAVSTCAQAGVPTALPPAPYTLVTEWDAWLDSTAGGGGRGKSIYPDPTPGVNEPHELVTVTCQDRDGTITPCPAGANPIRITVAVCWRHRNRTIGECAWNGTSLSADENVPMPSDDSNVIQSPAMLTTLVTCR